MIEELQKKTAGDNARFDGRGEPENNFALRVAPSGMMVLPTKDGEPMQGADCSSFIDRLELWNWRISAARSRKRSRTLYRGGEKARA